VELGTAGWQERKRSLLFSVTARQWLELNRAHWSNSNQRIEGYSVDHLLQYFARLLLTRAFCLLPCFNGGVHRLPITHLHEKMLAIIPEQEGGSGQLVIE
jgi:hypothetical protein